MSDDRTSVTVVGAGPTGALLALLLQRRGCRVTLYESRPDPRGGTGERGRSINLALADRGIHALRVAGVYDDVVGTLVPMRGRMIHPQQGAESLQLYGRRPDEVLYSISRHRLNAALLDVAARRDGIEVRFEQRMETVDPDSGTATMRDLRSQALSTVAMRPLLATDGAGSLVRRRMAEQGLIQVTETELAHGYKELSLPAGPGGTYRMAPDALHIWPRGVFMLIALPNADGSFTATLFLAKHGPVSFETLGSPQAIRTFLATHFPDAFALMPGCVAEFQAHPTGFLGTVHAAPWSGAATALIGDAAHAIVPFHGQGMNCCFEDCIEFDAAYARNPTWEATFADFFAVRKPNTDAIADMALENYLEMRERVADPAFRLQQSLALELEKRHPDRFIPRYSMVTFHHDIEYRVARQRGLIQARLLADLTANATTLDEIDYERAGRAITRELPPLRWYPAAT